MVERAARTFQRLDRNTDGVLDEHELSAFLQAFDSNWTSERLARLFRVLDADCDRKVSLDEFIAWAFGNMSVRTRDLESFRAAVARVPAASHKVIDKVDLLIEKQRQNDAKAEESRQVNAEAEESRQVNERLADNTHPYLQRALSQVESLEDTALRELMQDPGPAVVRTLEIISVLLGEEPEQLLRAPSVLRKRLICFELDGMGEVEMRALLKFVTMQNAPSAVGRQCAAAGALSMWAFAMCFCRDHVNVRPLCQVFLRKTQASTFELRAFSSSALASSHADDGIAVFNIEDPSESHTTVLATIGIALAEQMAVPTAMFDISFDAPHHYVAPHLSLASLLEQVRPKTRREIESMTPTIEAAHQDLAKLDKKDVQEVKSFARPPLLAQMTLECVLILFGYRPTWDQAKKLMSDASFRRQIFDYDTNNISARMVKKLQKYIQDPDYTPDNVRTSSFACGVLCKWTFAMYACGRCLLPGFVLTASCHAKESGGYHLVCTSLAGQELVTIDVDEQSRISMLDVRDDLAQRDLVPEDAQVRFMHDDKLMGEDEESIALLDLLSIQK